MRQTWQAYLAVQSALDRYELTEGLTDKTSLKADREAWGEGVGKWGSHLDSRGLTGTHLVSLGLTWSHLDSLGLTWTHLVSLGLTWSLLDSLETMSFAGVLRTSGTNRDGDPDEQDERGWANKTGPT